LITCEVVRVSTREARTGYACRITRRQPSVTTDGPVVLRIFGPIRANQERQRCCFSRVDSFSRLVCLYPVRRMMSQAVLVYLERGYFSVLGTPKSIVTDNARIFCGKEYGYVFQVGC